MITDLVAENFRSYRAFHLKVQQGQLNCVVGRSSSDYSDSNGSGKSSLLYAVLWALYGEFPGMENADSPVNISAGKDCKVEIYFNDRFGNRCVVQRYRKHTEHKNNVYFWQNQQQHSGDVKEVGLKIEIAIGMPYKIFLSTLVFTGERENEFASSTDKEQKETLNCIFPIDFSAAFDRAAVKFADADRAITFAQNEITKHAGTIDTLSRDIERAKLNADAWEKARQDKIANAEKYRAELIALEAGSVASAEQARASKEAWAVEVARLREQQETEWGKHQKLREDYAHVQSQIQVAENTAKRLQDCRARIAYATDGKEREEGVFKRKWAEWKANPIVKCNSCQQEIKDPIAAQNVEYRMTEEYKHSLDHWTKLLEKETAELAQITASAVNPEPLRARLNDLLTQGQAQANTVNAHKLAYEKAWGTYQEAERAEQTAQRTLNTTRQELARHAQEITNLRTGTNPHSATIESATASKNVETNALVQAQAALVERQNELAYWVIVKTMLSGGKGSLHHFMFEQMLPEMTATAQMFLNFFSSNTLKVAFRSHKKSGNKTVEGFFVDAERGGVKGYGNLSRGEQRRINVAISLTLYLMATKNLFNPGLLFLDEIADSLDQTGQQSIISLLEHFCREYQTSILLLTNERELVASVPNGYECVQENDESKLLPFVES